ncbi:MAG: cold-shock protein [Sphingomonadales bacterium]|nr:cold-shock protein [Sphingomonadales bacterium]
MRPFAGPRPPADIPAHSGAWDQRRSWNAAERYRQVFNQSKGFGFITPDQGGKDVFVHVTAVERSGIGPLDEGMRVSFETEPDKSGKGPKAVNLQEAD